MELKLPLPESLVKEAQTAGLLTPETIESMLLRQALCKHRIDELFDAMDKLAAVHLSPMTMEEIEAEIQAYREVNRPVRHVVI